MSRRWPPARRGLPAQLGFVALCALAVSAALVLSALRAQTTRVYAYSVAAIAPITTLAPGEHVCDGPVTPQGVFRTAVFMNSGAGARALITVHAGPSAAGPAVAAGILETATPAEGENAVLLTPAVSTASRLTLCVTEQQGSMTLYGGSARQGGPAIARTDPATTLWLQLLSARPHRFLGSLGLAFRRAALFRPDWVGAWTFWALLVLLFAGFPAVVIAVRSALRDEPGSPVDERGGLDRSAAEPGAAPTRPGVTCEHEASRSVHARADEP